ncbi:RidA family protein [Erwinia sp. AnSW2-5]|uniref:RidA family protein n=1 Tax=Erwinia sp. AnSW2-5 TaxID=3367692 RepID=UPI00385918BC
MTQITKVKTGSVFEEKASYSRIVAVDNWIFVSNTAGRNPQTKAIPEDISEQTHQVFANIEQALAAVDASLADVVMSRVFIQDPQDVPTVMAIIGDKFRGVNPASTVTCPPLGSTVYKVELEVTAYRGASKAHVVELTVAL